MTLTLGPEGVNKYVAPIEDPLMYPGRRPPTGFVLADAMVWPIAFDNKNERSASSTYEGLVPSDSADELVTINRFLESRKATPLEERFPVIGYGSNPVPGQLLSKFDADAVVPVVFGSLKHSDVVYNLISNMGYAYAEIAIGLESTEANVGVTFLDPQQLSKMITTEQNYNLAYSPSDVMLESGERLHGGKGGASYLFAGFRRIWVPNGCDRPIPIAELPSPGRKQQPLTQEETLALAIEEFHLVDLNIRSPRELAHRIREQRDLEEKPGKLKYELQRKIELNPRSYPSLASSLPMIEGGILPTKTFYDN